MLNVIWHFMNSANFLAKPAAWLWQNVFLGVTSFLWNWHLECKREPWPVIPLDVIASLVLVCIVLYVLWVAGSVFVWLGVIPAIAIVWVILWIIYFFAIPVYGSLLLTELMRLPKRWQKLVSLIALIAFCAWIVSTFSTGLAAWFLIMTFFYMAMFFESKPYRPTPPPKDAHS